MNVQITHRVRPHAALDQATRRLMTSTYAANLQAQAPVVDARPRAIAIPACASPAAPWSMHLGFGCTATGHKLGPRSSVSPP